MIARESPSFSQALNFPSFSQASNCFVTFEYGDGREPLVLEIKPGKKAPRPANPERIRHRFDGWFLDDEYVAEWGFSDTVGGDNFSLYAKWTPSYAVSFDANGGVGASPATVYAYAGESVEIPGMLGLSRKGYIFDGWNTDADGTGINHGPGDIYTPSGDTAFYANWFAVPYFITYYLNGGVNGPGNPDTYTVEDPDIVLENPTRGGDVFDGWHEDAMFFSQPTKVIRTHEARNFTLYARFVAKRKIVIAAQESATDRFEGDPKLYLTPDGADLRYAAGQPVMESGLENQAFISLFTREGWCGNAFLPPENRVGSDFEKTCSGSITKAKLADIENSAVRALTSRAFPQVDAAVRNPKSDNLFVEATVKGGGALSVSREGALWQNQRAKG